MKPSVRAAVAAVALSHALKKRITSVYDYEESRHRMISASITGDRVEAYDFDTRRHFSGNLPKIYHFGESSHVDIQIMGYGKYVGYDYGLSHRYEVTVTGRNATLYDFETRIFYNYSQTRLYIKIK